jgi:hypothetical protein
MYEWKYDKCIDYITSVFIYLCIYLDWVLFTRPRWSQTSLSWVNPKPFLDRNSCPGAGVIVWLRNAMNFLAPWQYHNKTVGFLHVLGLCTSFSGQKRARTSEINLRLYVLQTWRRYDAICTPALGGIWWRGTALNSSLTETAWRCMYCPFKRVSILYL